VDPDTGEITATDGRCRKDRPKTKHPEDVDYKKLSLQLEKRCASLEALVCALKEEVATLRIKD
jgi:hypothetical protein